MLSIGLHPCASQRLHGLGQTRYHITSGVIRSQVGSRKRRWVVPGTIEDALRSDHVLLAVWTRSWPRPHRRIVWSADFLRVSRSTYSTCKQGLIAVSTWLGSPCGQRKKHKAMCQSVLLVSLSKTDWPIVLATEVNISSLFHKPKKSEPSRERRLVFNVCQEGNWW